MTFDDDDQINDDVETQDISTDEEAITYEAGDTQLAIINQPEAPLEETELKVLLQLTGFGDNEDRSPVDIVMVLDISDSMNEENRIGKLKIAMRFLIQKLSPIDRLSVVTFSKESTRLFRLRQMTHDSQLEIIEVVNGLRAHGSTNMFAGLTMGVKVLKDRRYIRGRLGAVILMSDGDQTRRFGDARRVPVDNFAVHTFGFGSDAKPKVLKEIAEKSNGGTFSNVPNVDDLTKAFSQCLGGLLTVVVKDLNLTVTQFKDESTIKDVSAGNYPKTANDTSVTVSFGELYNSEVRLVMAYVSLPKVDEEKNPDVLEVAYKFSSGKGKQFEAPPVTAIVSRKENATVKEIPKLILEENRLMALNSVKEAMVTADRGELERAKNIVDEAKNKLERVKVDDDPTEVIKTLIYQLQQLSDFMTTQDDYEKYGRPYGMAFEASQNRQRYSANGDMDKVRSFATARMNEYLEQAKKFDLSPDTPPPTEKEDRKKDPPKPPTVQSPIAPPPIDQPPTDQPPTDPAPIEPPSYMEFVNKVLKFLGDLLKLITGRRT